MTLFEELSARGLIAQMTHEDEIRDLLDNQKMTFYIGFDPTADSLHVGHFLQLTVMSRLQKAGHRPIALLGCGTTMVGDPTGKSDMRKMLSLEDIMHNAERFRYQMRRLVDFSDGKALMLNNADWLLGLNYIDFLREVGVHFTVNRMLAAECFKSRYERGLSFLEFNYMIMQSYDFLMLNRQQNCIMQMGGDDQWSNIINGVELIRRIDQKSAYGMTFTLLTTSEGKKMGKTEKGAVWLDPGKTSPFDFFQYWRNIEDADVIRCMKLLTFIPLEEIAQFEKLTGSELNQAKERLALEITTMVHGADEAQKALEAGRSLFGTGGGNMDAPSTTLAASDFEDGQISVLDLLIKTKLVPSKGEGRRLIEQGGLIADEQKITSASLTFTQLQVRQGILLKKGKKTFHRVNCD